MTLHDVATAAGAVLVLALAGGCSYSELSTSGHRVALAHEAPSGYRNLGPVIGKGGGGFGAWVANESLIEYAWNDLRNKAAARGATHVFTRGTHLGSAAEGATTSATITGVAFDCRGRRAPPRTAVRVDRARAAPPAPAGLSDEQKQLLRAQIEAQRDAIFACASETVIGVRLEIASGAARVSLVGALARTPTEECVSHVLRSVRVDAGANGALVHALGRPAVDVAP